MNSSTQHLATLEIRALSIDLVRERRLCVGLAIDVGVHANVEIEEKEEGGTGLPMRLSWLSIGSSSAVERHMASVLGP